MTLGIKLYNTVVEIPELDVRVPESVTIYGIVVQSFVSTA